MRRAVTDGGSDEAVIVRTADHGDLLGAHGGLHQKWFNLYDEATRVPFFVARIGAGATNQRVIADMPSSHVDLLPTLLAAAGIDQASIATQLATEFSEVHPLPGRDLMGVVDELEDPDSARAVYFMTRDNMLEGDTGASAAARQLGLTDPPPENLQIQVPAHVAANFEGIVVRVAEAVANGGAGHLWKLNRNFDDPATWTEPGVRHLAASVSAGPSYRSEPLDDQWELYDLTSDAIEIENRWTDPDLSALRSHLLGVLKDQRSAVIPERNEPWPYATRDPANAPVGREPDRAGGRLI